MSTSVAVMDTLRAKLSGAGDDFIKLEIFNVLFEVARDVLRISPPTDPTATLDSWLTADQWGSVYETVTNGVLARMYGQANKPWSAPELAKYHLEKYMQELSVTRNENAADGTPVAGFSRIMETLRVNLPGALDANIKTEMWRAVDDFLRHSLAWTEEVDFVVSDSAVKSYTVTPTAVAEPAQLISVVDADDVPVAATMPTPGTVKFAREVQTGTYTAKYALGLKDPVTAEGYPVVAAWIVLKYRDAIESGTLAFMMVTPNKPYTNTALAAFHGKKYLAARGDAKNQTEKEHTYSAQRWRFPQTYASVRR